MLGIGYFASTYGQSVLVSLGSALVLFSLLTYAEPRVVEKIGASLRLASPAEVQNTLRAQLDRVAWRNGGATSATAPSGQVATINYYIGEIAKQITSSGFQQCDQPVDAQRLVFRDRGGLGIEWVVSWGDNRLSHTITSRIFKDKWSCAIADGDNEILLHKSFLDLEDRVMFAMRGMAMKLAKANPRSL